MERKYSKRKITKKLYILAAASAACILIAYLFSANVFNIWPFQNASIRDSNSLPSPKPHDPSPKNNAATDKGDAQPSIDPGQTSDQVDISPTMAATITTLKETDQEIHFAANVTNSTTAGTCVVTFSTPNDRPVTRQTNATLSDGTASCGPLTIPASEFSYLGTWQVTLHYYLGNQQATAQSNITIQ